MCSVGVVDAAGNVVFTGEWCGTASGIRVELVDDLGRALGNVSRDTAGAEAVDLVALFVGGTSRTLDGADFTRDALVFLGFTPNSSSSLSSKKSSLSLSAFFLLRVVLGFVVDFGGTFFFFVFDS